MNAMHELIESCQDRDAALVLTACHGILATPDARADVLVAFGRSQMVLGDCRDHQEAQEIYADFGRLVAITIGRALAAKAGDRNKGGQGYEELQ